MRTLAACALTLASASYATQCAAESAATDDDRCRSYGFIPGSDGYAQCRMQVDVQRQQACQAAQKTQIQGPAVSPFQAVGQTLHAAKIAVEGFPS
jgi:hypothetical protein